MSDYSGQDNYWGQSPQNSYNFQGHDFGQPDQQFEFHSYSNQPGNETYAYPSQKTLYDPTQNSYTGNIYGGDDFGQGEKIDGFFFLSENLLLLSDIDLTSNV